MQKYGMSEEHDKIIHQSKSILMLTSHFVTYLPTFPTDFS